jgi:hypothetical protein
MSQAAAKAAAQIYLQMQDFSKPFSDTFQTAREPYRAVIDLSRTMHQHNVIDGSEEYVKLVDCLEMLVCA